MNSIKVQRMTKWQKFYLIIALIIALSTSISFVINEFFFSDQDENSQKIILILPDDGHSDDITTSAQTFASLMNDSKKSTDQKLKIEAVHKDELNKITTLVMDQHTIGVISFNNPAIPSIYELAQNRHIPVITNDDTKTVDTDNTINLRYDSNESVNFMINYAKNIVAQQDIYIISDNSEDANHKINIIKEAYKNDTPDSVKILTVSHDITASELDYVKNYFDKIDYGSVYLAIKEDQSVKILPIIKDTNSVIDIFTPSYFGLNTIKHTLGNDAENTLNGIYTSVPILYDTANANAQKFAHAYFSVYGKQPDWLSASVYSAGEIITQINNTETTYNTIMGMFSKSSKHLNLPIKIGRYTGDTLISTPIQLTPIESNNIDNYVLAIKEKRATFINNTFMYKTNVIYTGLILDRITDLNFDNETAKVDFSIWFRYRGDFNPKDIVFKNAVEPVKLSEPTTEIKKDDIVYKEYTVSGEFRMNFNESRTRYDKNNVEIVFQHKKLNTNNLIFVTDFLGMPDSNDPQYQHAQSTIIADNSGWKIDETTLSQEVILSSSKGAPNYVEYQGEKPLFSQVSFVGTISSTDLNIQQYFDKKYFIYMTVLGITGIFFALMMDMNRWGKYWSLQAWILRLVSLPLILLAVGNIVIDNIFIYTDLGITNFSIQIYDSLWYLLPAYLLVSAIRRFVWIPLEQKAGKKIPEIAQVFVAMLVYVTASSLIVSIVFDESITSFLAASGVLATVVGLAIHDKISDMFSGIILNIEKPFSVGDTIRFTEKDTLVKGTILDIGWRGTVIHRQDGITIIIKNSDMLNIATENLTKTKRFNHIKMISTSMNTTPDEVVNIVKMSLHNHPLVLKNTIANISLLGQHSETMQSPSVIFHQVSHTETGWIGEYKVMFSTQHDMDSELVMASVWKDLLSHQEIFSHDEADATRLKTNTELSIGMI